MKFNIDVFLVLFQFWNTISRFEITSHFANKFSDYQNITSSVSVGLQALGNLDPVSVGEGLVYAVTGLAEVDHGACRTISQE